MRPPLTGASTVQLAQQLEGHITAIDLFPEFLSVLNYKVKSQNLSHKTSPLACSMDDLPFDEEGLEVIWCEGAIYNMGFEKGISYFKNFLKPKGILAVSEITWLTSNRPDEINNHWKNEYPEIANAGHKISILEKHGYGMKGYITLPHNCWLDEYYTPLETRFDDFLKSHPSQEAKDIVKAEKNEIALYKKYKDYYSYGFYIAQKN